MKVAKVLKNTALIATFGITVAFMSGCGGVSDAEMAQLNNLKTEVNSLQSQSQSLKDQRAQLEKEVSEKEAKLQKCNKQKEETKANLEKLSE